MQFFKSFSKFFMELIKRKNSILIKNLYSHKAGRDSQPTPTFAIRPKIDFIKEETV